MSEPSPSPETLPAAALEISDAAERRAYLDRACGGDAALRKEVESLLGAHKQAGGFMSAGAVKATLPLPPCEKAGNRIGRYKLLEQIGKGGFGVVWMAEQEEPVRRRVVLTRTFKADPAARRQAPTFQPNRQSACRMAKP